MSSKDVNNWQSGLFGCFEDCQTCCYGFWCPCCLYGENVHKTEGTGCYINCCLWYLLAGLGCQCLFAGPNRTMTPLLVPKPCLMLARSMRTKYGGLRQEPCNDCCVTWCCSACAICQEAREIKYRGVAGRPAMQFATQAPQQQSMPAQGNQYPPAQQAYPEGNYYTPAQQAYPQGNQGYPTVQH